MPRSATKETALSVQELSRLLDYNPLTGCLTWKVARNSYRGKVKPGTPAGTPDKHGYLVIVINGLVYWGHYLAWYMHYGVWPSRQVDHRNLKPLDNSIDNLRLATMTEQRANQRVRRDSIVGLKGVQRTPEGRYRARIRRNGKSHYLGNYDTAEEAHAAYEKAAQTMFGGYARSK